MLSSQYRPRYRVFLWPVTSVSADRISAFRSTRRESMQLSKLWCNNGTGHATPPRIQSGSHYNDTVNDNQEKVKCKAGEKKTTTKKTTTTTLRVILLFHVIRYYRNFN